MDASKIIDQMIAKIPDWRGKTFAAVRRAILAADPEIVEEWKWMGSPVWSRDGMIAVANAHKNWVKVTFNHGANFPDPRKLFNNGFEGNMRRAIDYFEGDIVDERALTQLVRIAIEYNQLKLKKNVKKPAAAKPAAAAKAKTPATKAVAVKKAVPVKTSAPAKKKAPAAMRAKARQKT